MSRNMMEELQQIVLMGATRPTMGLGHVPERGAYSNIFEDGS
jgi:hypothetical protein